MKQRLAILPILVLLAAACAGTKARDKVLLPAVATAWPPVKKDAEAGAALLADASQKAIVTQRITDMDAAIAAKDRIALAALRAGWPSIRAAAESRIQDRVKKGEISIGVSQSLLERVKKFEEAFFKATDR